MQPRLPHGQRRAAALDDHVADLAGAAAAQPGLAVEDQPAADAGAPEHAEHRLDTACRRRARTRRRWRPGRRCRRGPGFRARSASVGPSAKLPSQPGRLRALDTVPVAESTSPGEPTPTPGELDGLDAGRARPPRSSPRPSARRRRPGPPSVGVGWRAEPSTLLAAVDDDRLDLGAAEVDPAAERRRSPGRGWSRSALGHPVGSSQTPDGCGYQVQDSAVVAPARPSARRSRPPARRA